VNVITYADMFVRARPASQMPGKAAERIAAIVGVEFAKPGERTEKLEVRRDSAGALLGYSIAIGFAVAYAALRRLGVRLPVPVGGVLLGGAAMAASDSIATGIGVTDPRAWGVGGWTIDAVSHAAFGVAAAATLELVDPL
jgi:hypothetical protein